MTAFRVWAPRPALVELVLGDGDTVGSPRAMVRGDGGWWSLDVAEAGRPDYAFLLDGDGPFPDPRSAHQPAGVHGPSRVVDHGAFPWSDGGWSAPPFEAAVLYELHVGTFSAAGTFDGAIEHLDHLGGLGVTHVELMPVVQFPGDRGWGYDGVDLFAPHDAYGGPEGLRRLVDACHARGLAVLLDVVYNHLGPDGNHLARFGPYYSDRYTTPWGDALNFDGPGSDEVRAFVIDNARSWLRDYHVDGLRLDAVHEMFDRSAVHILEELATTLHADAASHGRRFVIVAESDLNDPRLIREVAGGGYGLDAQWNDDFRHSLHVALTGEVGLYNGQYNGLADLGTSLRDVFVYTGRYSSFRERHHGRPVGDLPVSRFVGFLQNHDQAGNRALGERSSHLMSVAAQRVGLAVVLLGPFVPLLFFGEEWGAATPFLYFTDHGDPDLADAVRAGRSRDFAEFLPAGGAAAMPDPQDRATLERSRLDWSEPNRQPHADLLAWSRALIELRRTHPELHDATRPEVRVDPEAGWLTFSRGSVAIAIALREDRVAVPIGRSGPWTVILASEPGITLDQDAVQFDGVGVACSRRQPADPGVGRPADQAQEAGWRTSSSASTSMPNRSAASRMRVRARSRAAFDSKSVWFQRAIALRAWLSSWIGRWRSPSRSMYANWSSRSLSRSFVSSSAMAKPPCPGASRSALIGVTNGVGTHRRVLFDRIDPRRRLPGRVAAARLQVPCRCAPGSGCCGPVTPARPACDGSRRTSVPASRPR